MGAHPRRQGLKPVDARKPRGFGRWLKDLRISRKLAVVITVHLLHATILLIVTAYGLKALDGSRAYVEGEGLWSKAQKDATLHLLQYADTGNETYFDAYLTEIDVTLGDRQAREELEKDNPDLAVVRDGFLRGRLHPDDIDDMSWLFRTFRREPHLDEAIGIWARADENVSVLMRQADALHAERSAAVPDPAQVAQLRRDILETNRALTGLEEDFSSTLGTAARFLSAVVVYGTIGLTVVFVGGALMVSAVVARQVTGSLHEVKSGAEQMAAGNLDVRIRMEGRDEVSGVAHAFDEMMERLAASERDRQASANAVQQSEARFRGLVEAAPDAMVIVDASARMVLVNAEAERLFGYRREEMLGQPVELLVPLGKAHGHVGQRDAFLRQPVRRPMGKGRELNARRRDGTEFPVEISLSPVESPEGRVVIATVRDISERRLIEQERLSAERQRRELEHLQEVNRFKTDFINTAAHELRTPLMPLRTQVHLLLNSKVPPRDDQLHALQIVQRNLDRMVTLADGLLAAARTQAKRLVVTLAPIDLGKLTAERVESFEDAARQRGLTLSLERRGAAVVPADEQRTAQVLGNLLTNALKFTPRGGSVQVRVIDEADRVRVEVTDTGIGIEAAGLQRLFQPFSQVHDKDRTTEAGTGLGLYISREIISLHGGTLEARSPGLGKGSTFWFTIPRSPETGPQPASGNGGSNDAEEMEEHPHGQ